MLEMNGKRVHPISNNNGTTRNYKLFRFSS